MIGSRGTVLRAGGRHLSRVLSSAKAVESTADTDKSAGVVRHKSSTPPDTGVYHVSSSIMPETVSSYPVLDKLGFLNANHIRIKNPGHVEQLLSSLIDGSFSKLQVIADFDRTMTRVWYMGKICDTCHGIMDNSSLMPTFYREEANRLLAKYYPIEIDPKMTEEEKIPFMIEWYNQIHELIVKCKVSQKSLEEMVDHSNARLRDGTEDLFKKLHGSGVPVLVFSAGMGDILEQVLRHFNVYTDNVKVVSNFFKYDENGIVIGFEGDLIHVFNKNENAIHSSDYFDKITGRNNVVLLGDSLGDIKMAVGVPQPSNVLKIGFLNDKIEERLDAYMNGFDIVLIDDQTMDAVNSIVKLME